MSKDFKISRYLKLFSSFATRNMERYLARYQNLPGILNANLAKLMMSALFSRHKVPRRCLKECIADTAQNKIMFSVIFTEFKRHMQTAFKNTMQRQKPKQELLLLEDGNKDAKTVTQKAWDILVAYEESMLKFEADFSKALRKKTQTQVPELLLLEAGTKMSELLRTINKEDWEFFVAYAKIQRELEADVPIIFEYEVQKRVPELLPLEAESKEIEEENKPYFVIAYEEFKRQADSTYIYPLKEEKHERLLHSLNEKLKVSKGHLHENRVVSFGPSHPAADAVLGNFVRFDENITYIDSKFGVKLTERELYLQYPMYLDRFDYFSLMFDELPFRLANEKELNIGFPKHFEYIRNMFSVAMRNTDPRVGICAAVLDCGKVVLVFWKFEDCLKLNNFCKEATGEYMHVTNMIKSCNTVHFPLGLCKDLFEFTYRFVYTISDVLDIFSDIDNNSDDESEFDLLVYPSGCISSQYVMRVEEMLMASQILNQCLHDKPKKEIKDDDNEMPPLQRSDIRLSVAELIDHFQNYNQPYNKTIQEMYMREVAKNRNVSVAGVGWYFVCLPSKYPFS